MIQSEQDFQDWVCERFDHLRLVSKNRLHLQDFSSMSDDVPDLGLTFKGQEFWLELKFGRFKLLHSGYDRFYWRNAQAGQTDWLRKRERAGAICGYLGYAIAQGDHTETPYITFHIPNVYEAIRENRKYCIGALMLSPRAVGAHCIKTGADLLSFIETARAASLAT